MSDRQDKVRRNCHACIHLDYYEKETPESFESSGYYCKKREYRSELEETRHLYRLQSLSYRVASKKCCEAILKAIEEGA